MTDIARAECGSQSQSPEQPASSKRHLEVEPNSPRPLGDDSIVGIELCNPLNKKVFPELEAVKCELC